MRKIKYADELEEYIGNALNMAGIQFVHESEKGNENKSLDFYLPKYNVFIEVKKFHTYRVNEQLKRDDNIILVQGRESVSFIVNMLRRS